MAVVIDFPIQNNQEPRWRSFVCFEYYFLFEIRDDRGYFRRSIDLLANLDGTPSAMVFSTTFF